MGLPTLPQRQPLPTDAGLGLAAGAQALRGVGHALRAARMLCSDPPLRRLALVPAAIGAAVSAGLAWALCRYVWPWATMLWTGPAAWEGITPQLWQVMRVVAAVVAVPILLAGSAALVLVLSPLLAGPWMVLLSQRVEQRALGQPLSPWRGSALAELSLLGLGDTLMTVVWVPLSNISLVALWLLPGLGGLAAVGTMALWAAGQGLGLALGRRGLSFAARRQVVARAYWQVMGTGAVLVLFSWIPLVSLLTVPMSAAAGALSCVDLERRGAIWRQGEQDPS